MGGDHGHAVTVDAALLALKAHQELQLLLVGDEAQLSAALQQRRQSVDPRLQIVHASEVVGMHEKAAQAVRSKRDSSLRVGLRLVSTAPATLRSQSTAAYNQYLLGLSFMRQNSVEGWKRAICSATESPTSCMKARTRAVCRRCYVHPMVFTAWSEGRLGRSLCHSQCARFSLVGFSSPGTSFR